MLLNHSNPVYILSLIALLSGLNATAQERQSKSTNRLLETTKVQELTLDHRIAIDAKVEAVNQTTLTAQTNGQIAAIYFDGGDHVKAGEILVKLKDKNQKAGYEAAVAALKATKTELDDARRSFERTKSIFAKKLTSQESLDSAKARLNIAKANNEAAQARLNAAEEQLNYTLIEAPYSGIVLERHVNLGEIVSPGTPLFSGTSLNQIKVVAQIPQVDMPLVKHYADALIELPQVNVDSSIHLSAETPNENIHITGDAISFYAYASANSSTFKVKLKLPEQSFNLYPGMYLKTHFKIGSIKVILVPTQAIVKRAELRAVYVQDAQGKLHLRQIRVGKILDQQFTQVVSGLDANETIILNPLQAIGSLAEHQRGE